MPSFRVPKGRRSKRVMSKRRASLVINLDRDQKRLPCLVLDSSNEGFRLRGNFHLRRGQMVEIILDEDPLRSVRCSVVWVGKTGSKQEGEVGLETV
jgi:PilZ domain